MNFYNIFTPSRTASNVVNLLKTIFQIIIFWVFFLYVIPIGIVWFQLYFDIKTFDGFEIIGWLLFMLFQAHFYGISLFVRLKKMIYKPDLEIISKCIKKG
jgi:hypothetical protein